jgi:hypothetical protein
MIMNIGFAPLHTYPNCRPPTPLRPSPHFSSSQFKLASTAGALCKCRLATLTQNYSACAAYDDYSQNNSSMDFEVGQCLQPDVRHLVTSDQVEVSEGSEAGQFPQPVV